MSVYVDSGVSNAKSQARVVDENIDAGLREATQRTRDTVSGAQTALENGASEASQASATGARLTRADGVLTSSETELTPRRYGDRPEGLDQFGAEEAERDPVSRETGDEGTGVGVGRYRDRAEGLDQFGGEEAEREK